MRDETILKVENLEKTFGKGNKKVKVVNEVSFQVKNNEIFALLGPNGAGKTTTIKMILDLVTPDKGEIEILSMKMPKYKKDIMREIGVILEGSRNLYWNTSLRENVYYFANLKGSGMQQKSAIICAISTSPKILILDELLLGLDILTRFEIEKIVKELREVSTLIISSHDLRFIEKVSDRILIINKGSVVVEGTTKELIGKISFAKYRLILNNSGNREYLKEIEKD
ncbi:ATP-binding cassette domain-containing protein [Dictyoglomus thermophilum]|uniref:ABC-type multidrug transport system, ATPase component n=1 Tax=Dictyoglomus thermophilum (strain ATCC 35947 / DSM 3960 / H-6-12) TaxID=309799 RepID=B5YC22_DICT6|nr:ATP-binding cassette domain-containing protein [Dictyoglomus thermophilum]ACI19738.1 ABC-type multidrug transport system, ATPase component [Dictyoglomus thermophilum H-6-12]